MSTERLLDSVFAGPEAHDEGVVAWRVIGFLVWWRTWLGIGLLTAGFFGTLALAPQFGPLAVAFGWLGGWVTHAVVSPVMQT